MPVTEAEVVTAPDMTRAVWQLISCYALLRHRWATVDFRPYVFKIIVVSDLKFMRYVCFSTTLEFRPYRFDVGVAFCLKVYEVRMFSNSVGDLIRSFGVHFWTVRCLLSSLRFTVARFRNWIFVWRFVLYWTLISWVLKVMFVIFMRNIKSFCLFSFFFHFDTRLVAFNLWKCYFELNSL